MDLALKTDISQNSISRYERNERIPKADKIVKICNALAISSKWLLDGMGETGVIPEQQNIDQNRKTSVFPIIYEAQNGEDLINIPLVAARLSAGIGSLQVDRNIEGYFAFSSAFLKRKGNPQSMVVMRVEGDSMSPEIRDEDMVLIDQNKTDIRLGRIFAVGFEDAIYLKRIDKEPGKLLLKSVNPAYPPIEIRLGDQETDSFRVIGQVLWVGREY